MLLLLKVFDGGECGSIFDLNFNIVVGAFIVGGVVVIFILWLQIKKIIWFLVKLNNMSFV